MAQAKRARCGRCETLPCDGRGSRPRSRPPESSSLSLFASARGIFRRLPAARRLPRRPLAAPAVTPIPTPGIATLSPEKITAGMKGYGVSDFGDGKGVQRFDVEILGVLKRYAPRQDLILARVSGAGLENSGIIAGMSGSPSTSTASSSGRSRTAGRSPRTRSAGSPPSRACSTSGTLRPRRPFRSAARASASKAARGRSGPIRRDAGSISTADLIDAFSTGHFAGRLGARMEPALRRVGGRRDVGASSARLVSRSRSGRSGLYDRFAQTARWMLDSLRRVRRRRRRGGDVTGRRRAA